MKLYFLLLAAALACLFAAPSRAQSTAFTYQGRLHDAGNPAIGTYDFQLTLYDSANQPTGLVAGPLTASAVSVKDGLFTTTLDFGANVFTGPNRWLEIAVRPQGGSYSTLTPRQPITSVPYAAFAMTPAGPKGDRGDAGLQGIQGIPGPTGPEGAVGPIGPGGPKGDKGDPGDTGPQGIQGAIGLTGPAGPKGDKGDKGDPGSSGPPGPQGIQGPIGLTGSIGPKGDKGDKGDTGLTGSPGPQGEVGPQGPAGPLSNEVALRNATNTFTELQTFSGPIRLDHAHGFSQSSQGAFSIDAPFYAGGRFVVTPDGRVGIGIHNPQESLSVSGGAIVDGYAQNAGDLQHTLRFGFSSSEAIGSVRVTGIPEANFHGLDFYTAGINRLSVSNNGHVTIRGPATVHGMTILHGTYVSGHAEVGGNTALYGNCDIYGRTVIDDRATINGELIINGPATHNGNTTTFGVSVVNGLATVNGALGVGTGSPQNQLSVSGGMNIDQNNSNNGSVANALTFGSFSGEGIGSSRSGANQFGLDFYTGSQKRMSIANFGVISFHSGAIFESAAHFNTLSTFNNGASIFNGATISGPTAFYDDATLAAARLNFGAQTRQMINLWNTGYGIGVQSSAQYFRSDNSFIWYRGGVHNDNFRNGGGGTELMWLGGTGNLLIAGTFGSLSDRNAKQNFEPINERDILEKVVALPLAKWSYKTDPTTRHIGPIAQDFHQAFNLGDDEKRITTVDADGVALAAIQGLNKKLEQKLEEKENRITELEARLTKLEQLIAEVSK